MRKPGRHRNDRLRAMRFALWAQHRSLKQMSARAIAELLDVSESTAQSWRQDWFKAISPIDMDGIPPFLFPQDPLTKPAATGKAHTASQEIQHEE